jgi:Bacterial Ig-like domain (group 2)/Regulator of chromosome condensation (RCC1) repeat
VRDRDGRQGVLLTRGTGSATHTRLPHARPFRITPLVVACVALVAACHDSSAPEPPVVARVDVVGLPDSVGVGDSLNLAAEARDSSGKVVARVTTRWRSLDPAIATVDSTGLLRGVTAGSAAIVVTTRGRTVREDTVVALVRRLPRRFAFGDFPDSVFVGKGYAITVEVQDGAGRPLGPAVTWSSTDTSLLRVDSLGMVQAINVGSAWIRASAGDRSDSVRVRGVFEEFLSGRTYVDIGAGTSYPRCGVAADGRVWCESRTETVIFHVPGAATMRTIEGGQTQACGLAADSTLYCWGQNSNRVYGTVSSTGTFAVDTLYPGGLRMKWRQFTLGDHQQACGIAAADSVVYCWGHNDNLQVGRAPASSTDSLVAPFATPLKAKQVDLSAFHGCAVDLDDAVWCWGSQRDAYGLPSSAPATGGLPTRMQPPGSFVQVSTGDQFTCARTRLGEASCWGWINGTFRSGGTPRTTPVPVAGGGRYVELFTGFSATRACGITGERALHCWNPQDAVMTPRVLMPGRTFVTVAIGGNGACALSTEGKVYCW